MTITQEKIRSIVMQRLNNAWRLSIIVNKCNNVMLPCVFQKPLLNSCLAKIVMVPLIVNWNTTRSLIGILRDH